MIEFDFEKDVERMIPSLYDDGNQLNELGTFQKHHRVIVCRHWLLGLCHNGSSCSYLHRLDKSKMPPCKHLKMCKIKNCPLKHTGEEEMEECIFYKQGFCCNGPKCLRRHIKRMPEECPAEVSFESNAYAQTQSGKKAKTNQPNDNFKVSLCTHWLLNGACPFNDTCHFAHGETEINEVHQTIGDFLMDSDIYDPTAGQLTQSLDLPFPTSSKFAHFVLQAPDLRSLSVSRRRGVWAVPVRLAAEMNAALRSSEHVLIYFCVRPLRGIYGVAKMVGPIPPAHSPSAVTPEFPVQWLRTLRVSLRTVAQLKLAQTGMFLGRSSADGRFDHKMGLDMLLIASRKPQWDWSLELEQAEAGIRLAPPERVPGTASFASSTVNEYYPSSSSSGSGGGGERNTLHPDALFSQDWVDRAAAGDRTGFGGGGNRAAHNIASVGAVDLGFGAPAIAPPPDFYTGSLPGFVFCAPPQVIEEMFAKMLLGLPRQMQDAVIHPNVPLFIFDTVAQVLLGVFHADSPTAVGIDPLAFVDWAAANATGVRVSSLPVQLRFRIALEAPPLSVHDPELLAALGENVKSLGGPLGAAETRNIANLLARRVFAASVKGTLMNASGATALGNAAIGNGLYYKPPFRCVDTVAVDMPAGSSIHEVKRRLLGTNASTIKAIVDELGSKHSVRIRMRGIGSGFTEGPTNSELPEPLHFNVSADNEALLQSVMARVQALVDRTRAELQGRAQ